MMMSHRGLPILNYHAIDRSRSPIATEPAWFARTIARLIEAGGVGVDLATWIGAGRPEVSRGFAVTFDDALASIRPAVAILERAGIPATIFAVTDRVGLDNRWPSQPRSIPTAPTLDWSDLSDLARRGFTIGAHTRTHPRLDTLDDSGLEGELRGSRDTIEARLGRTCRLMAYPYGEASARVRRLASGWFDAAFGTRLALASASDDVLAIPRVDAYYLRSQGALDGLVSARLGPRLAIRGGLRKVRQAARRLAAIGA